MPKGKASTQGGIAWIPQDLPDCMCEALLYRDRKKGIPEPTEAKKVEHRARVNEAVKLYVGATITASPDTQTAQNKLIAKASATARKLLYAMKSKKGDKVKKWRHELADRTDYIALGHYTWIHLNTMLGLKGGDIKTLACYPFISGAMPVSQVYLTSVKILAEIQPEGASSGGFCDPFLCRFITELGSVWHEATGLTPMPKSERWKNDDGKTQRDDTSKIYLFAEWVQEVIRTANFGLKENYKQRLKAMRARARTKMLGVAEPECNVKLWQIEEPKEGSILDIIRLLLKKEKSGTPRDIV